MFATNGPRVTCFAKRLHETRPRVADPVPSRRNTFASAPIGIAPAHASAVATTTDATTRFDLPFRPRRSSFVRAIVVVRVEFLLSIRFQSVVNSQHPRFLRRRWNSTRSSRRRWNSSSARRSQTPFPRSARRSRVAGSTDRTKVSQHPLHAYTTNHDSTNGVGTKMIVRKQLFGITTRQKRATFGRLGRRLGVGVDIVSRGGA